MIAAGPLDLVGQLGLHGPRRRRRLLAIGKGPQPFELPPLDKFQEPRELLFRLAGKAGNERGPQRQSGNPRAQPIQEDLGFFPRCRAAHAAQYVVVNMLQGDVDIRKDFSAAGDHVQKLVGDVHRIEVHQADPFQPFDLFEPLEQVVQPRLAIDVHAVEGRVLGHHDQFPGAVGHQFLGLGHDVFDRLAGMFAAHLRNRAKGAGPIAALGNLEKRQVSGRDPQAMRVGQGPRGGRAEDRPLFVQPSDQPLGRGGDIFSAENAHELIDARIHVQQLLFFALGQAARDDHAAGAAFFLQIEYLADHGMRFTAGIADERAAC